MLRWQDLIYLKCPKCSSRLEEWRPEYGILYVCPDPEKHFVISRRKLADILMDEDHILRQHLSEQQRVALAEAINNLQE